MQWDVYTCRNRKRELKSTKLQQIPCSMTCLSNCYSKQFYQYPIQKHKGGHFVYYIATTYNSVDDCWVCCCAPARAGGVSVGAAYQ
jgi:hypothetical protein